MNILQLFLIGLISLVSLSCRNKIQTYDIDESNKDNDISFKDEIIEELSINPDIHLYHFPPIDSIKFEHNLLLLKSIDNNNRDSVFNIITLELKSFIGLNNIEIPKNEKEKYELWEALFHHLYGYDWWNAQTMAEIYYYSHITELGDNYLIYYLQSQLFSKINRTLAGKLKEEQILKDSLISAQREYIKTHIDEAIDEGSSSNMKYYTVASLINKDYMASIGDLYFTLMNDYTICMDYQNIPKQLFDKEYNHISHDLIPVKSEYYDINPNYDENKDRQALRNEKKAWEKFIAKRQEISNILSGNKKKTWDNATNRFKKSHLILLKNEFQGLGIIGYDMLKTLLSDTCTYEELFAYPNFSTQWKNFDTY